jgi:hypothetical protein
MKTYGLFLLAMLISFGILRAQLPEDDPLSESYIIHYGGGDELVTFEGDISIYKFYKALEYYNHDTLVKTLTWSGFEGYPFSHDMDLADLDNDELEEIVATWINNNQVEIVVLKADPARLIVDSLSAWDKVIRLSKTTPAVYKPENDWLPLISGVFIKTANLDSDPQSEFVVAYWADDGMIEITAYDVGDSLNITELGSIRDQVISEPPEIKLCEDQVSLYDIECADFNGDSIDEILLTGRMAYEPAGWQIFANVYSYNESSGNLEARIKDTIYTQTKTYFDIGDFNTASGYFHSPDIEDAVIGFLQYNTDFGTDWTDTIANILIPVKMDAQLSNMSVGEPIYQRLDTIPWECWYYRESTLIATDFNNNGMDELLSAFSFDGVLPTFKIYQGDQPLSFSVYADLDHFGDGYKTAMAVGNFYKDTVEDFQPVDLIITTEETWQKYYTEMYEVKTLPDGSFDTLEYKYGYSGKNPLPESKTETLLAGNLDGDIRLGKPKRYSVTEILQPLVILNAPPIHFDVFDNQIYDVCRSYNENVGEFVAKYIKESEQSTEVQTEVNKDWSMSTTLSGGFSCWGLSVSSHLTEKYGKKFSKVEGSSRTVTVGFEIEATVDDQIYATVMDYDLWEYPVYGNNKFRGNVLVVEPQVVRNSWFDSKSWKGYSYIPNHEVGNILSYRRYPLLSDNPMLREKIKGDYGLETSFLISGNSSYNWFLNFTDFTESQATTTNEYSRDWGVSVSYWGSGFSMEGSYNSEDIQTQRTTVESGINLDVHLDAVDMSMGETRYEVTPYAYWASNGALVIDYAVSPEIAGPGGEDTWWDAHYGYLADPAFILPWLYDPEKGDAISDIKRHQTKDIVFRPEDPVAGEIVTIYAQVHNFSLIPTPGPIGVRFYVGDPDNGGTLIVGEGDVTEVFTDGAIQSRGTMQVEMKWKIPEDLSSFPRIYAVIDADKELPEIHENNNKSWTVLQKTTGEPSSDVTIKDFLREYSLEQNFPNPFSHSTRIRFSVPVNQNVTIDVYNLYGQKIETLIDKTMLAGSYEVEFDGQNHPSGIYLCRIKAGEFQQVMKMVLFK